MAKERTTDQRKQRGKLLEDVVFPLPETIVKMPKEYLNFIEEIKQRILNEKLEIVLKANKGMILLYWKIGKAILEKQKKEGWGTKVIDRMSFDLKIAFPEMKGFSPRNLKYMKKFAESWADFSIVQRSVALIPWRSNIILIDKIKDTKKRLWYAEKTILNGFGKDMLCIQIDSKLYERTNKATTNFKESLPPLESDFTSQVFKDPYIFDFLGTDAPRLEAELEQKLIDHIQKFLLELGQGFAFVGRQVHLELGGDDFYMDLLFYHLKLRCYVVIELKAGKFEPGFISKLNMHLNVVNKTLKHPDDNQSIGLLLVKSKNKLVAEYSLSGFKNPIGVANWENEIKKALPKKLQTSLPSIEEIEKELEEKNKED
jgi:predicted nuclease of restriction endonuclease-like (RecB) superfamily